MQTLRLLFAAALLAALLWAGARPVGPLPPLRPLLDPWAGAWRLSGDAVPPTELDVIIPTLEGPVEVRIDIRGVPHVFASSETDAWRAQGYLVARDRLFQMNLQTRATAGRLTEWVGGRALEADRESRRLGLARAAERQWAALAADDPSRRAMEAYAEGVNAWIDGLGLANRPMEYRLLGVVPDRWEP
ncbi:MAG TPA: penicillin acylase family protein, partial [Gemmatimonadales bacterium]|nr:penicillin acylase family protein [Gemmatimonadales bacterium]